VKAQIYISDPVEADGISARVELLPRLVSAALVHSTIEQAGWNDNRRFAGKSFTNVSSAITQLAEDDHAGAAFTLNKENSLSAIHQAIMSLQELRDLISAGDEAGLSKLLKKVTSDRAKWMEQRTTAEWEKYIGEKPPSTKERLGGLFGIRTRTKKKE
jgi:prephenate dehydrogenase